MKRDRVAVLRFQLIRLSRVPATPAITAWKQEIVAELASLGCAA